MLTQFQDKDQISYPLPHVQMVLAAVSAAWFSLSCSSSKDAEQSEFQELSLDFVQFLFDRGN